MFIDNICRKLIPFMEDKSKVIPMTVDDSHIIPMMPEKKPHISKTTWGGKPDPLWWTHFRGRWYGGETPEESYDNFKKFHYPKEFQ